METEIIFVTIRMTPPFFLGGAEVSQRILAEKLVLNGYKVSCIGSFAHPIRNTWERLPIYCEYLKKYEIPFELSEAGDVLSYNYKGISCIMLSQERVIEAFKKKIDQNVSLVFTWLERSDEIIRFCNDKKIKVITWIHDVLNVGMLSLQAKPSITLFTSEFVRQRVEKLYNQKGYVLYPPFDFQKSKKNDFQIKEESKIITLINPIPEKGVNTFLELSTHFSDFTFLVVEGWRPVKIDEKYLNQNVRYVPSQQDMSQIYKQTHILLVPSHFEEGFGRVVVEAGYYGVPSIVSNRGALPEALGKGGIVVKSHDITEWCKAIHTIVDIMNYKEFSHQAKRHSKSFMSDPVLTLMDIGVLSTIKNDEY